MPAADTAMVASTTYQQSYRFSRAAEQVSHALSQIYRRRIDLARGASRAYQQCLCRMATRNSGARRKNASIRRHYRAVRSNDGSRNRMAGRSIAGGVSHGMATFAAQPLNTWQQVMSLAPNICRTVDFNDGYGIDWSGRHFQPDSARSNGNARSLAGMRNGQCLSITRR